MIVYGTLSLLRMNIDSLLLEFKEIFRKVIFIMKILEKKKTIQSEQNFSRFKI